MLPKVKFILFSFFYWYNNTKRTRLEEKYIMMNFANMMQQAQQMQKKLQSTQAELAAAELVAESAGGAVKVVCDGRGRFKSITIKPEAINPEQPNSVDKDTIETLEDLITSAMNQATDKACEQMEAKMKQITGGINIPGLF